MENMSDIILSVQDLEVWYDDIQAVRGISFEVQRGEIFTLIGGNGAGKTSTLRAISGVCKFRGNISFMGKNLVGIPAESIVARGLAHVPEGRGIFGNLTVSENLRLGAWVQKDRRAVAADLERVLKIFPRLQERLQQLAGTLSGGEQQMLALGRAIMSGPQMLLLDEPSMGIAPLLIREIYRVLEEINRMGASILLVEQNANLALRIANRAGLLETGQLVLTGSGAELLGTPRIQEVYLGA
jgi:branched-chain amino acid transport system ATP-binding protein